MKETIIVTGSTGFVGSKLVKFLLKMGCRVIAIVRSTSRSLYRLPSEDPNLIIIFHELDDFDTLYKILIRYNKPIAFYHLAWEGVDNLSRNQTLQFNNIPMTLGTIQLASKLGCSQWIGTGSQAEYGPQNRKLSESDPTNPRTLYGTAKLAAGLGSIILGEQLGIDVAWVRVFSLYGPDDNSGWMITDITRQLREGKRPAMTKGEQLWDYLYIDDAVNALYIIGHKRKLNGIYNLGSGNCQTIKSIAEIARDIIDPSLSIDFGEIPYRSDQVMHLEANINRLVTDTGWKPQTNIQEGLKKTIDGIIN